MATYSTLKSSELRAGMVVNCHGMMCYIDREIHSRESDQRYGPGDTFVYWTKALILNREDVSSDSVPMGWTQPRLSNGYLDTEAVERGEHRWSVQGNDNARWSVLTASIAA